MKNDIVRKTVYDELVIKVNAMNTNNLVKKIDYNTKFDEIEKNTQS